MERLAWSWEHSDLENEHATDVLHASLCGKAPAEIIHPKGPIFDGARERVFGGTFFGLKHRGEKDAGVESRTGRANEGKFFHPDLPFGSELSMQRPPLGRWGLPAGYDKHSPRGCYCSS